MLNKVLIITHGLFGIELKKSAEMIMGEQENVEALGLIPGQSVDELHAQALEIVKKNEADGFHTVVMAFARELHMRKNTVGETRGSTILAAFCTVFAPSTSADSRMSSGSPRMADSRNR